MLELLEFAFKGANLIPTILLMFTIFYWIIVIIGVIDVDALDFDLDLDVDTDLDLDTDVEFDGDVEVHGMASVLSFFNIGHMPLMVFISFYALPLWMVTLNVNDFLNIESFIPGLIVLLPAMFGCLFVAKFLTIPVARFYRKMRTNSEAVENIVGKICTAKMPIASDKKSQAEIKVKGTSVLIYAKSNSGQVILKGETALVIEYNQEENFYYVEPYQS